MACLHAESLAGALSGGSGGEFDPQSEFILKNFQRRVNFEKESDYRVSN